MSATRFCLRKSLPLVSVLALVIPLLLVMAAPVSAAGTIRVDGDATGCVLSPQGNPYGVVYCKIQDAVTDASAGDTVHVYPGTYGEGVDLSSMNPDGDLTLVTVNSAGVPTPGTVTVVNPGDDSEFYTSDFDGDLTIDGFNLHSGQPAIRARVDGSGGEVHNVEIRNVTATNVTDHGIVAGADGDVTITNCAANSNYGIGIWVWKTDGNVTITNCTANDNKCYGQEPQASPNPGINGCDGGGIRVEAVGGQLHISDCTANGNLSHGISVRGGGVGSEAPGTLGAVSTGDVTITNCTANRNGQMGFHAEGIDGILSIQSCIARDNESGVSLGSAVEADAILVNGSIICGNECGLDLGGVGEAWDAERFSNEVPFGVNVEGNWWGCAGGPEVEGCDPICQPDSIPVDFTPWIKKISPSATVDPAMVGQPTVVSFQFSGNPSAVYLGEGPGDRRGPAPFTVTTDNGTLNGNGATVGAFVGANGTLKVTLVPEREGTATVTVTGPCGIGELEGATAVLGVLAEEFVPEPGTVLLLGSGLMGLAGYASLRLRRR